MERTRGSAAWAVLLSASIRCDVTANACPKRFGDRVAPNDFRPTFASIAVFAPAIATVGYAPRSGQGRLVTRRSDGAG